MYQPIERLTWYKHLSSSHLNNELELEYSIQCVSHDPNQDVRVHDSEAMLFLFLFTRLSTMWFTINITVTGNDNIVFLDLNMRAFTFSFVTNIHLNVFIL